MSVGPQHPPRELIEYQLERILADPLFQSSQRLSRFLRFVVQTALAEGIDQLKEYVIGLEVFGQDPSYNPQENPVVRIMAGRLRGKLAQYYLSNGLADPVFIDIPKGGYVPRFVERRERSAIPGMLRSAPKSARALCPGREHELNCLQRALEAVPATGGAMWLVSGDAGMGKTTLGEMFLSEIRSKSPDLYIGRGSCSERLAETDAYVPVLDALHSLLRGQSAAQVAQVMKTTAPTWYVQLAPAESGALPNTSGPASHERMRREIVDFIETLSRCSPLILFLDDMQWADGSTCDLLNYLSGRLNAIGVFLLMTYRPTAVASRENPFLRLKLDLDRRGIYHEQPLPFLTLEDVAEYISREFPVNLFPVEFARVVHQRTEGNPLFMRVLLRFFHDRAFIVERNGAWVFERPLHEASNLIPTGIGSLIRLKLDRLGDQDLQLLSCAAVQGVQFDSAVIARALSRAPAEVEEALQELENTHNFVSLVGRQELPNQKLSLRYSFVHVFYQNALYASIALSRRAEYSSAVAQALVALTGGASRAVAAEIAVLFEEAQDHPRAAEYFNFAARNAARLFAYPEAAILAERGLHALSMVPASRYRDQAELGLLLILSLALMVTRGYAASEVEQRHRRAFELCVALNENRRLITVLWGLHTCEVNAGNLQPSLQVAEKMMELVGPTCDTPTAIPALHAVGTTLGFMGKLCPARDALERIFRIQPIGEQSVRGSLYLLDPCVTSLSMLARVLAFLGHLDEAMEKAVSSLEFANRLSHPQSVVYATFWVGWVHHARAEYDLACRHLEPAMALSDEYGLAIIREWGRVVRGSALAHMGSLREGISQMRESLANQQTMRSYLERPYCLTLIAEALGMAGAYKEAIAVCEEALDLGRRTEGRCYEPETHRVWGEVMLAMDDIDAADAVCAKYEAAINLARENQSRLLGLRAAVSYYRLRERLGELAQARHILTEFSASFPGDVSSPTVIEARNLLARTCGTSGN